MSKSSPERFWSKVDKSADCWLWTGAQKGGGYGAFRFEGKGELAHRVSYSLSYGPIPDGMLVCHTCDVKACVNPSHLFLGTHSDNMLDMVAKGRRFMPVGAQHSHAKLTREQVLAIRSAAEVLDVNASWLAKLFGVTRANVRAILTKQTWKHV
jgi:hypothetical protein